MCELLHTSLLVQKVQFRTARRRQLSRTTTGPPLRSCPAHPQRKRSRAPKRRRFRHSVPRLSSISDAWGRLNVATRFIIYRGTASFTARSVQGPLRHLVASSTILAERVKVSIKGLRRMDVRRGPMHNDRDLHGLAVTRS